MKSLFCLLALFFSSQAYADPMMQAYGWKEESTSYFNGKSKIKVLNPTMSSRYPTIQLDACFTNGSSEHALVSNTVFLDPFLQYWGDTLPATLAIFDDKHQFLKNLPAWAGDTQTSITADNWLSIPRGAYVGTHINAIPLEMRAPSGFLTFPAGTYYVQLIYNESFIAPRPRNKEELAAFRANKKWKELFRSNIVKIELVD